MKNLASLYKVGTILRVPVPKAMFPNAGADTVWELEVTGIKPLPQMPAFRLPDAAKVVTTQSGLKYEVLEAGTGESPSADDSVVAYYTGWFTDGKVFDSAHERGEPSTFGLRQVIPGWTEGLQLMKTGGKFLFEIPGKLAYGAQGRPPKIPGNATLVFLVELVEVKRKGR
ncbi:MAG: FKBP-type peptidyl-prolyl cis-trans isomerase [Planctomycetes bacterium]|nr:FKBP-type peptidyl-prolyl cis-trans isomerase [Planctomycetota bacterium]